jgi:hypothetical protein
MTLDFDNGDNGDRWVLGVVVMVKTEGTRRNATNISLSLESDTAEIVTRVDSLLDDCGISVKQWLDR